MTALLLTCSSVVGAGKGWTDANTELEDPPTRGVSATRDCADKCASMLGDFVRQCTPEQVQGAVLRTQELRTSLASFCTRWSTGLPLPREEYRFCQLTTSRLLRLSEVKARTDPTAVTPLLYDMKAVCREVGFGGLPVDPAVCNVHGAEAGVAPRWLEQFVPLNPKLRTALEAKRERFPARESLAAGNAVVMNHRDADEVMKLTTWKKVDTSIRQLFDDPNCLPPADPHRKTYASCAVVGSGGASMREPRGGAAIDRHEAVFRFNFAQTAGYEGFVGSKTTVRVGNHETSRAFDEVIRQQPNARAALSAKGWNCDEYIQWSARYPAVIRSLCSAMHPTFYVMRQTLVQEYREFYSKVCALIDEMPRSSVKSLPSPQISNRISSGLVGVMTAMLMCEKVSVVPEFFFPCPVFWPTDRRE